jgi:opacity protein-like surface antigen
MECACYVQLGRKNQALAALQRSLKLHPDDPALKEIVASLKTDQHDQPRKDPLEKKKFFLRLDARVDSADLKELADGVAAHPGDAVSPWFRKTLNLNTFYVEAGYCLDKFDGFALGFSDYSTGTSLQNTYMLPVTAANYISEDLFSTEPFYSFSLNYYRYFPDSDGRWYASASVGFYSAAFSYFHEFFESDVIPSDVRDEATVSGNTLGFTVGWGREWLVVDDLALDLSVDYQNAQVGKLTTSDGQRGLAITGGGELTMQNAPSIGQGNTHYAGVDLSGFELRVFLVYYPF